ncbi:SDR family NAD(P)-dependent oxidoreductase [Nocardia sp. NPDC004278]
MLPTNHLRTKDLTGRTVVITGAGSGIGRELALLCARRGASLALCDINLAAVEVTAEQARQLGRDVLTAKVDVSSVDEMEAFADSVQERFGAPDLLVNNAGVGVFGGFLDTTIKDWEWLVSINLMGVVHGCTAFVPDMVKRGQGHVVNVASAAGLLANPSLTAYSATKFAVRGFSEALRSELKPLGIGVTAICPGVINTPITANSPIRGDGADEVRKKLGDLYAKRGYTPERVAVNILKAVDRNTGVAPIAAEAHLMYTLARFTPRIAAAVSAKLAAVAK